MKASNFNPTNFKPESFKPKHFLWTYKDGIGTISLNNPAQKNPLTFESYAELRDVFSHLRYVTEVKVIVFGSNEGNFCSGGNVHDIIGPLTKMNMSELLAFTRMTGDLVKTMRACPQPIIAAVDGVSVGAGAIISMASDFRLATPETKTAFLFNRVGLAGCDMGACAILPRIIGQGRASELLFLGRSMSAEEGERWGYFYKIVDAQDLQAQAHTLAARIASGPTFANSITKNQLNMEWSMSIDMAIEAEAQAQAICMQTEDFKRAYHAFVAKEKPVFEGN
ncbi:MAG: enoyl-CoA hydratase [Robiginitomaculum sp.]|nr:MAG: enoyl-CoA hydratase [Robiginitomaculum sp.]